MGRRQPGQIGPTHPPVSPAGHTRRQTMNLYPEIDENAEFDREYIEAEIAAEESDRAAILEDVASEQGDDNA